MMEWSANGAASIKMDNDNKSLTLEAAGELDALLRHVADTTHSECVLLIAHDGEVIRCVPGQTKLGRFELPPELIATCTLEVFENSNLMVANLAGCSLHQISLTTTSGTITIAGMDTWLLVSLNSKATSLCGSEPHNYPPWSRGDPPENWPPNWGPDDPSRMPLRRKPPNSGGEIALPLPD